MVLLDSSFHVSLLEELNRFPKLKTEDIESIQQWLTSQPQLPSLPDILIAYFLHSSSYNLEAAKQKLRLNCEFKRNSEFFNNWDPLSDIYTVLTSSVLEVGILPAESRDKPRVMLVRYKEDSVDLYDYVSHLTWNLMTVFTMLLHEGEQESLHCVMDTAHFSSAYFRKIALAITKKYQDYCNSATPCITSELHFINSNATVRRMYKFCWLFLSKRTQNGLHFHASPDEYFNRCRKDVVPPEYGGAGPTLLQLHEENTKRVISSRSALMSYRSLTSKAVD